jgi:alkylated DNA repair protein alkB family protein 7
MLILAGIYARRCARLSSFAARRPQLLRFSSSYVDGVVPRGYDNFEAFGIHVHPDFLSEDEEASLVRTAGDTLNRRGWEDGHWDGVIRGFREAQVSVSRLAPISRASVARAAARFPKGPRTGDPQSSVHFLELSAAGEILAHVDSVKFSGGVVAGLCLLSDAVMELVPDPEGGAKSLASTIRILLPRRALYTLSGAARYEWAHAIPAGAPVFGGGAVTRGRRISVMLRDELVRGDELVD